MWKSKIGLLEQIWAWIPYVTFYLGHPVCVAQKCEMMDFFLVFSTVVLKDNFLPSLEEKNEKWWIFYVCMYVCVKQNPSLMDFFGVFFVHLPLINWPPHSHALRRQRLFKVFLIKELPLSISISIRLQCRIRRLQCKISRLQCRIRWKSRLNGTADLPWPPSDLPRLPSVLPWTPILTSRDLLCFFFNFGPFFFPWKFHS